MRSILWWGVLLFMAGCGPNPARGFYSAFIEPGDSSRLSSCGDYDGVPSWCYPDTQCVSAADNLCQTQFGICEDIAGGAEDTRDGPIPPDGFPCGAGYCGRGDLCYMNESKCVTVICIID